MPGNGSANIWRFATAVLAGALLAMIGMWATSLQTRANNSASISDLNQKVAALNTEVSNLKSSIDRLGSQVAVLSTRVCDKTGACQQ